MSTTKEKEDEIDYLHPDGKPAAGAKKLKTAEEKALAESTKSKSIAEADGHHMCSPNCQSSTTFSTKYGAVTNVSDSLTPNGQLLTAA